MRIATSAAAALIISLPVAALAHHGWSRYDSDNPMTITGPVVSSSYDNPHGSLVLVHDGRDWTIILAPPARMETRGLTQAMIAEGREVTVEGYPHRDGSPELRAERITAGGTTVELR
ncbi:hypothetical protein GCM10011505_31050 [Tistrella bauzanensis]|uniref:DUF5666 domain-containing protein n=1 Tax=Tistrella bauzanensis TaxID=657419 RepID=A0ABQ1IN38_9PROT|nr:DUF6152 family protein [Tistrella bauzanensis]GGB47733.1 hypothetical protein GCM10011505_31050 [Tistrella bauzanensis]